MLQKSGFNAFQCLLNPLVCGWGADIYSMRNILVSQAFHAHFQNLSIRERKLFSASCQNASDVIALSFTHRTNLACGQLIQQGFQRFRGAG